MLKLFKNNFISELKKQLGEKELTSEAEWETVYQHLWPFCDPGCGDELLPVSNKMIEDLDLLPNLKEITGLEWLNPPKKLLKALEDKQITLKPWES